MKSILQKIKKTSGGPEDASERLMEKAFESLPGEGGAFRVLRRNDRGQLKMLDVLPRDSVLNPDDLLSSLQERWGGGRYYIVPTKDGKKFGEGFGLEFDGEPKKTKKTTDDSGTGQKGSGKRTKTNEELAELREENRKLKERDHEDRLIERVREEIEKAGKRNGSGEVIESVLKNLPQIVTGVSSMLGGRESAADMLEKVSAIWKNVESSMPQMDPIAQLKAMAELLFTIGNQSRAPVVTAGQGPTGGALASFLASVIAEFEKKYLGGMPATSVVGPRPALAPSGFAGQPEANPQQTTSSAMGGFPGGVTKAEEATEQPPEIDQSQNILPGFDLRSLGVDPETRFRELLASRTDVGKVAEIAVYLLNFVGTFAVPDSTIAIYVEGFFTHPAAMFDQMAPLVPELRGASAEYLHDLREAIVKEVAEYGREQAEEAAARSVAEGPDDEKKTLTPDQREAGEVENGDETKSESEVGQEEAQA